MSTSSKPKSRAPAHPNRTAFRHNKSSKLTRKIAESTTTYGLCQHCTEKQQWRVKYRKYKPLTAPRKCNSCREKTIKAAYRTLCGPCARSAGVCASCGLASRNGVANVVSGGADEEHALDANQTNQVLRSMTERQRRTAMRRVTQGEDQSDIITQTAAATPQSDSAKNEDGTDDDDTDEDKK